MDWTGFTKQVSFSFSFQVGNQEAVDIARSFLVGNNKSQPLLQACKKLVDLSVSRGSLDDTSVMLIKLEHYI